MLFFQVLLLAGYGYAHLSVRLFRPRVQAAVHVGLIVAAVALLPITPSGAWKPLGAEAPTWHILVLLAANLALPYLVMSSTSPLMQAWFSVRAPGVSPYRLYALSNLGCLLALLSYPILIEPYLGRDTQATVWTLVFVGFALISCHCAATVWRRSPTDDAGSESVDRPGEGSPAPTARTRALWLALPACASLLLLAVTNQITSEVVVPWLWVLPLGLYLLSFILCFHGERWYSRSLFGLGLVPSMAVVLWWMFVWRAPVLQWVIPLGLYLLFFALCFRSKRRYVRSLLGLSLIPAVVVALWVMLVLELPTFQRVVIFDAVLFVGCMVCHGELYRLRPPPRYLTGYYLMIALGGAVGGAFVSLVAPVIFHDYWELHMGLLSVCGLTLIVLFSDEASRLYRGRPTRVWLPAVASVLAFAALLRCEAQYDTENTISRSRSFYGPLRIRRLRHGTPDEQLVLYSGGIRHGMQFTDAAKRNLPGAYYTPASGGGLVMRLWPPRGRRRIGVIGLGVGTLAAYGREGDSIRFYELDPEVSRLAETRFTFLADSPADVEIVLGDARASLEREPAQNFDILVLDAFTADAAPIHLLTREAFEVYLGHLKPDGVIAIVVPDYLHYEPVFLRAADHFALDVVKIRAEANPEAWSVKWMLLSKNTELLQSPPIARRAAPPVAYDHVPLWTDDYASIFPILFTD